MAVFPSDDAFWNSFYARYLRETGDHSTADELTQRLRVRVAEWMARGHQAMSIEAVIHVAYVNVLRDWFREKKRNRETKPLDQVGDGELQDEEADPSTGVEREFWQHRVRETLASLVLSERQRIVLETWFEPVKDAARLARTTVGALKTYRQKLRRRLQRNSALRELLHQAPDRR